MKAVSEPPQPHFVDHHVVVGEGNELVPCVDDRYVARYRQALTSRSDHANFDIGQGLEGFDDGCGEIARWIVINDQQVE